MTASVDSTYMDPIFEEAMEFNLIVSNGCLEDQMSVSVGIDDYIYYLDEDTTYPEFDNQ